MIPRRRLLFGLMAAAFSPIAAADTQRQSRAIAGFHGIKIDDAIDVEVLRAEGIGVIVEAESAQLAAVRTVVEDGILVLSLDDTEPQIMQWFSSSTRSPRAIVSCPTLDSITINGSGDLHARTMVCQKRFDLRVHGSGDVRIEALGARQAVVQISGSGDVSIGGAVSALDLTISGSGDFSGLKLKTATARVDIRGSGDASVWARDALEAHITGSGDLAYAGSPRLSTSTAGSGSVRHVAVPTDD